MSDSFDYDGFLGRSLGMVASSKNKSFAQLAGEIEALRQEYKGIRDRPAREYMRRDLDGRLLLFAIDTSQPRAFVDRLYSRNIRQGFNELHAEVASAIMYAHYCGEQGDYEKGIRALQQVKELIDANKAISSRLARNCLQAIEESISRLKEHR